MGFCKSVWVIDNSPGEKEGGKMRKEKQCVG